jgi:hypothetical protein
MPDNIAEPRLRDPWLAFLCFRTLSMLQPAKHGSHFLRGSYAFIPTHHFLRRDFSTKFSQLHVSLFDLGLGIWRLVGPKRKLSRQQRLSTRIILPGSALK